MPLLQFQQKYYDCPAGETVLDNLTGQGAAVPFSCRSGACQTCLMRATKGMPPSASQSGLKPTLREQGYFLACMCKAQADMEVALAGEDVVPRTPATVVAIATTTLFRSAEERFRLTPPGVTGPLTWQ